MLVGYCLVWFCMIGCLVLANVGPLFIMGLLIMSLAVLILLADCCWVFNSVVI